MNAISSIKTVWQAPTLRRFRATEELKAEILAQTEQRPRRSPR